MLYLKVMAICFFASLFGPMCGIGGGSIIKPLLDITQAFTISQVSFLSGFAVVSMAAYSLGTYTLGRDIDIEVKSDLPLAIAAAFGGLTGRLLFVKALGSISSVSTVGIIQSAILLILSLGALYLSVQRDKLHFSVPSKPLEVALCFVAGLTWVFLGIGGGPFNMILLAIFFMLPPKRSRQVSLLIVLFSQVSAMGLMAYNGSTPEISLSIVVAGALAAVGGAQVGKILARKLPQTTLDKLYNFALVLLVVICSYNMYNFTI